MDGGLGVTANRAHFSVKPVQLCLLPVLLVLGIQAKIDLFSFSERIDNLGDLLDEVRQLHETMKALTVSHLVFLELLIVVPLITVHALQAHFNHLIRIVEVSLDLHKICLNVVG